MSARLTQGLATIALGVIIAVRQQLFITPKGTEEQARKRRSDFRKLGILLIVAGAFLVLSAVL